MHRVTAKWRPPALVLPIAAIVAAVALFLGGTIATPERTLAVTFDTGGVSCANVVLVELQEPVATAIDPSTQLGKPPGPNWPDLVYGTLTIPGGWDVALALTYSQHNTTTNVVSSGQVTYNARIAGVIAGQLVDFPLGPETMCAKYDKQVAQVVTGTQTDAQGNPPADGTSFTLDIDDNASNPPLAKMIVYWNSSNTDQQGFYEVQSATSIKVTLERVKDAICNGAPTSGFDAAPGTLHSCIPDNKGLDPIAYTNVDVTKKAIGGSAPQPRSSTGTYQDATEPHSVFSISCQVSEGVPEGAAQNSWTRYETTTVGTEDTSDKTPSYGIVQLFNPTQPNTCANITSGPNQTKVSTNVNIVWSLDSQAVEGDTANWDSDYDKDGCEDWEELSQPPVQLGSAGSYTGGRDPFNPYDCDRNLTGIWGIEIETSAITLAKDKSASPGAFYRCRAYIDHNKTSDVFDDVTIYCYTDDPTLTVNPDQSGQSSCGPAPAEDCGDGLAGSSAPIGTSPPPPPYGQVGSAHNHITGSYDDQNDEITLQGCLQNVAGSQGPNIYWRTDATTPIDALTGHGKIDIWLSQTTANCTTDNPQGSPDHDDANIQIVQHAGKIGTSTTPIDEYDFDYDGCSDKKELGDNELLGGLRDPFNRWDLYDVVDASGNTPGDNAVDLVNDIFALAARFDASGTATSDPLYGPIPPAPAYHTSFDRQQNFPGGIPGSNNWNIGGPDGQIDLVNDIFAMAAQFDHSCR